MQAFTAPIATIVVIAVITMAAVTTLSAGGRIATQPAKDHDSVAVSDVGLLRMEDCACHGSLLFHVDITIHVAHVAGNVPLPRDGTVVGLTTKSEDAI